ncbi:unnamed protein product [Gongylonema pulchrum]|uniref:CaMBD domain-containing protein n=1 Tax=Gongylonema pulchrum TaxID=637853 RepID=A0A183DG39_9BILA|nr:unnamed protein product [Gongylonema pulchrum]
MKQQRRFVSVTAKLLLSCPKNQVGQECIYDPKVVEQLENEIKKMATQVEMWIRELADISEARTKLQMRYVRLRSMVHLNSLNMQMANIGIDRIEQNYDNIGDDSMHSSISDDSGEHMNGTNRNTNDSDNAS